jgi:hypothetical protein
LIIWLIDPDETKVKANAPLNADRTAGTIEEQISRMLAGAEAIDAREGRQLGIESNGSAMPKDLGHCADRSDRARRNWRPAPPRSSPASSRRPQRGKRMSRTPARISEDSS